jgi:radical SAM superfamily enzyme YgiQ (UPF0313 family)
MRILLLKPYGRGYYVVQPNLGFGYLGAIMLECGHDVRILDSVKEGLSWDDFGRFIEKEHYDIIGIQMFTHEVPSVMKHVEIIRKKSPETLILLGGAHISGDPEGTMRMIGADFGFVGEAEVGIERFMKLSRGDYRDHQLLSGIPNLVWRDGNEIVVNGRDCVMDLDDIGYPAWHLMPPASYPTSPHGSFCRSPPVAPVIASRGCPFQCTFCAGKMVTGSRLRYRSIKNVIDEIVMLHEKYGVNEIHIEDDNFTFKKEYVMEFCKEVLKLPFKLSFALPNGVRIDTLDEELLVLMEKAGFYSIAIGIESGSNRILKLMRKRLTTELIREKVDLIKRRTGMNITGFFMMGYPGETKEEVLETIEFAKSIRIDKASFTHVMPLPGTELWDVYKRRVKDIDWINFFSYRIVEGLSDIPLEDLRRLHQKAIVEFYSRLRIILGLLSEIKTLNQIGVLARRAKTILLP